MSQSQLQQDGDYGVANVDGVVSATTLRRQRILGLYAKGKGPTEIARLLGLSVAVVEKDVARMRKAGIKVPSRQANFHRQGSSAAEEVLRLFRDGKSSGQIARIRGVSPTSIRAILKRARDKGLVPPATKSTADLGIPRGVANPHYRRGLKRGMSRAAAVSYAKRCEAGEIIPVQTMRVRRVKSEPKPVAAAALADEPVRNMAGRVRCLGHCGGFFDSPHRINIRRCDRCKRASANILADVG
jgi:DNA-binding CsgD family transcriptional regulator